MGAARPFVVRRRCSLVTISNHPAELDRSNMEALGLGLVLLAAVLVSSVIDQVVPKISSPLIQIALGVIIAIIAQGQISITLNPELFLVLFIAPLLFHEAREADKGSLWTHRRSLLSYAIGLVVAIALIVGFAVHWMIPSISLAAAFALGAALGPTLRDRKSVV